MKTTCTPTAGMPCALKDAIRMGNVAVCCLWCQLKMFKTIDQPAKCEISSVIRFLTARNVTAAEIHRQKFLGGKRFATDDEVKEAVEDWLSSQAADFYDFGIQKLVERYDKCLNKYGKYAEK
ncbi:hypothetical protein J437_LFUL007505 [Ladona fulva]|uniref:Uncharacterized protein n=1 Tax=Ladona fulva TaxID=123851 RepID=A0A8K0P806_LADFU|nr:hypothetical protein J437_LFUL007505 [Ladona fulva]